MIRWQESVGVTPVYLSVITVLEVRLGLRRVQARDPLFAARLETWYHERLLPRFRDSLLEVNLAEAAAELSAGRTLSPHDALIAATARVHQLTLVTRFVDAFVVASSPHWENKKIACPRKLIFKSSGLFSGAISVFNEVFS